MRLIFSCPKKMWRIWAQSKIEARRIFFVCEARRYNKRVGLVMSFLDDVLCILVALPKGRRELSKPGIPLQVLGT